METSLLKFTTIVLISAGNFFLFSGCSTDNSNWDDINGWNDNNYVLAASGESGVEKVSPRKESTIR